MYAYEKAALFGSVKRKNFFNYKSISLRNLTRRWGRTASVSTRSFASLQDDSRGLHCVVVRGSAECGCTASLSTRS